MEALLHLMMLGWPAVIVGMFYVMPARRAVIFGYLSAFLLMPIHHYNIASLPDYDKITATSAAVMIGIMLTDWRRVTEFRPSLYDLPMFGWCVVAPIAASLSNHEFIYDKLGLYDGLSHVFGQIVFWGVPYIIGRLYLTTMDAMRDMAIGLVIGAILYMPLCLWEVRMSPQLHRTFYGYHPHSFGQQMRAGGYRPMVFVGHGLLVALFYTCATISAFWLWYGAKIKRFCGVPMVVILAALLIMLVLCKTLAVMVLLPLGILLPLVVGRWRTRWPVVLLLIVVPGFMAMRIDGRVTGDTMVRWIEKISVPRAASLRTRLENETALTEKAMQRPYFGWARWGRSRIFDKWGKDVSITDGLWIIALGEMGLFGLSMLTLSFMVPLWRFAREFPPTVWLHPRAGPAVAAAAIVAITLIYNVPNSSVEVTFITVALGGLTGLRGFPRTQPARAARRRPSIVAQTVRA
jgi:hypothetical protein